MAKTEGVPLLWGFLRLLRLRQWAKNGLVFAAWIFTGAHAADLGRVLVAFVAMGLAASATYAFNDAADAERDRAHPKKRHRPVAAGVVSRRLAAGLGAVLTVAGLLLAASLNVGSLLLVVGYLVLQGAYNLVLKRTTLADVFTIALGFVLRAVLGAAALGVGISLWLLFCTGALALTLGFAKRRSEFVNQGEARAASRESLAAYSLRALDALVVVFATAATLAYALYCIDSPTARLYPALPLTAPPVFYGVSRYLLIVFGDGGVEDPTDALLRDPHLLFALAAYLAAAGVAVAGVRLPFLL